MEKRTFDFFTNKGINFLDTKYKKATFYSFPKEIQREILSHLSSEKLLEFLTDIENIYKSALDTKITAIKSDIIESQIEKVGQAAGVVVDVLLSRNESQSDKINQQYASMIVGSHLLRYNDEVFRKLNGKRQESWYKTLQNCLILEKNYKNSTQMHYSAKINITRQYAGSSLNLNQEVDNYLDRIARKKSVDLTYDLEFQVLFPFFTQHQIERLKGIKARLKNNDNSNFYYDFDMIDSMASVDPNFLLDKVSTTNTIDYEKCFDILSEMTPDNYQYKMEALNLEGIDRKKIFLLQQKFLTSPKCTEQNKQVMWSELCTMFSVLKDDNSNNILSLRDSEEFFNFFKQLTKDRSPDEVKMVYEIALQYIAEKFPPKVDNFVFGCRLLTELAPKLTNADKSAAFEIVNLIFYGRRPLISKSTSPASFIYRLTFNLAAQIANLHIDSEFQENFASDALAKEYLFNFWGTMYDALPIKQQDTIISFFCSDEAFAARSYEFLELDLANQIKELLKKIAYVSGPEKINDLFSKIQPYLLEPKDKEQLLYGMLIVSSVSSQLSEENIVLILNGVKACLLNMYQHEFVKHNGLLIMAIIQVLPRAQYFNLVDIELFDAILHQIKGRTFRDDYIALFKVLLFNVNKSLPDDIAPIILQKYMDRLNDEKIGPIEKNIIFEAVLDLMMRHSIENLPPCTPTNDYINKIANKLLPVVQKIHEESFELSTEQRQTLSNK